MFKHEIFIPRSMCKCFLKLELNVSKNDLFQFLMYKCFRKNIELQYYFMLNYKIRILNLLCTISGFFALTTLI